MSTPIFTTEQMVARALAAEIRHRADGFTHMLEDLLDLDGGALGDVVDLRCEADERIDLLLTYRRGGRSTRVGIEAKFDHEITSEQLSREAAEVDLLLLLVVALEDATEHRDRVDGVITWAQAIDCFVDSRLTAADLASMPLTKLRVERLLRGLRPADIFPRDWDVSIRRGGAGMPAIRVESPALPDGRRLRGQIQVTGRRMPASLSDARFEYHVGVEVRDDDDDLPIAQSVDSAPGWIPHLFVLEREVLGERDERAIRLSRRAAGNGGSVRGANKLPLVGRFMTRKRSWLAKGYTDGWALGIKSTPTPVTELEDLCRTAASIFADWFAVSTGR